MIRLGNKVFSSVLACIVAASLAACGGGGSHQSAVPSPAQTPNTVVPSDKLVQATFKIVVPAPTATSAKARRPAYISQATRSIRINMTADTAGVAIISQFNVLTQVAAGPGAPCTGAGPYTCTIAVMVPPGNDTFTFTSYDDTTGTGTGASHILSQQIQTLTLVKGKANAFTVTFDANANTIALDKIACNGYTTTSNGSLGAVTFSASYTDPAGKTIVTPGLPKLKVNGSTSGGTITGTGGNVTFTVDQNNQQFTLTPTTGTTVATIPVQGVQADSTGSSDGLSFTQAVTFTFTNIIPSNILAIGSQSQINLYGITFGATDVITPLSTPASLTATGSGSNVTVDFVNDLLFDGKKNLIAANGGTTVGGDVGNLACFPAASLVSTANTATTNPANVSDPIAMALGADGSIGVANQGGGSFPLVEFALSGGYYVPPAGARATMTDSAGYAAAAQPPNRPIVALPASAYTAGTYAIGLNLGNNSRLALWSPGGVENVFDSFNNVPAGGAAGSINDPTAMGYDSANSQILAADFLFPRDLHFYSTAATPVQTTGYFTTFHKNTIVATSPDGHIATAGVSASGRPSVQVYNNVVPTRSAVGSAINYGVATPSADAPVIWSMFFINNSRLVVTLSNNTGTSGTTIQGVYIYDITDTTSGSPALKAFLNTPTFIPRASAYLP